MLLHTQCLPTELAKPVNQAVIAAALSDCNGDPLVPGTKMVTCADIPAPPDGSETIVTQGTNVTVTGTGTAADPYVVNAAASAVPDGSETIVTQGANVTVTGTGTAADPYVVNAAASAVPDGSETIVTQGANVTVTGTGTAADPYVVNAAASAVPDGSETIVTQGANVTVTGTGTAADPYVVNATGASYTAAATCDTPTKLYGENAAGDPTAFNWAAANSTSAIATLPNPMAPGAFNIVADGAIVNSQLINTHPCRSMNVLATAVYSVDYGMASTYNDFHYGFDLNTTGFTASPPFYFTDYHDENKGGHHARTMTWAITVPPGGSAYFSTQAAYATGSGAITITASHTLFGVTV